MLSNFFGLTSNTLNVKNNKHKPKRTAVPLDFPTLLVLVLLLCTGTTCGQSPYARYCCSQVISVELCPALNLCYCCVRQSVVDINSRFFFLRPTLFPHYVYYRCTTVCVAPDTLYSYVLLILLLSRKCNASVCVYTVFCTCTYHTVLLLYHYHYVCDMLFEEKSERSKRLGGNCCGSAYDG